MGLLNRTARRVLLNIGRELQGVGNSFPPDAINIGHQGVLCSFTVPEKQVAHGITNPSESVIGENRDPRRFRRFRSHRDRHRFRGFHSATRRSVARRCKRRRSWLLTRIGEDFVDLFTLFQDSLLVSVHCCLGGLYHVCADDGDNSNTNRVGDDSQHQWRSEIFQPQETFSRGRSLAGARPL